MALSWISGYNNINYLNQMIRSVEDTLSNDYNNLDNIPIIKIISSTSNPQNIWELKEGMYLIDGIVYVDNNTSYEVSNLFVSMTARLENSKYVLSAFIPFFKGLYEYILKSDSTEYEEHQIVILATHERMLTRYNETPYEPNGDYNPATKKYVDDKANEIITELDNIGVNKETITSLKEENRIRDIKLQALLSETSDRNISISEDTRYFDMPLSIDNGIVTINEMIGDTLVNVCDQEESVAITKSYAVENENHIALQGEYDGSCRPVVYGNTLVNHNADWDGNLQTGIETSVSGTEDVQVEGIKGQEVSVVVEGNTVLNHALGKTSAVVSSIESENEGNYVDLTVANDMSSVVEIEGRTMVNLCDQKDPIAITKSYTVENSGNHIALQGEYDGSCRPVIQGNTMVNLFNISDIYESQGMRIDNNTITLTEENAWAYFGSYIPTLKPSTLYTFVVNIIENTTNDKIYINNMGEGQTYFPEIPWKSVTEVGTYTYTATTASDLTNLRYSVRTNPKGTGYVKLQIMIFEGDLTQTPELIPTEYVEGLKSSFEDEMIPKGIINIDNANVDRTFIDISVDSMIKNTIYTVIYNLVSDATTSFTTGFVNSDKNTWLCEGTHYATSGNEIVTTFTTTEDIPSYFKIRNDSASTISISNFMLLEGDWTSNPPTYDEVANHAGKYRVEYKVTGKNKFDGNVISDKYINDSTYNYSMTPHSDFDVIQYKITNLSPISISNKIGSTFECARVIDENGNLIEGISECWGMTSFTYQPKIVNCILQLCIINGQFINIQIEEGTEATEYEPYKGYTKTFYLNSPLLEGDTIEDINGVATHIKRYGKVVLDGSQYLIYYAKTDDNSWSFAEYRDDNMKRLSSIINDRLPHANITLTNNLLGIFGVQQHPAFRLRLTENDSLGSINAYLQDNPTTVVYELASPIYETISTESILCDSYINGHLDFDSAVPIEKVMFKRLGIPLKYQSNSTDYIVKFNSDNNGVINEVYFGGSSNPSLQNVIISKGINILNMATGNGTIANSIQLNGIGFNASNIVVTEATDADFDYFEGLKSSYEYEVTDDDKYKVDVKVTGKNKVDLKNAFSCRVDSWSNTRLSYDRKTGGIIVNENTLTFNNTNSHYVFVVLPCDFRKGKTYHVCNRWSSGTTLSLFTEIGTLVSQTVPMGVSTFVANDNYKFVAYQVIISTPSHTWSDIRIVEGTEESSYEPYFESTKTFYLNSPLLEGDKIVTKNGKVYHYHKMGRVVLDGSENWVNSDTNQIKLYKTMIKNSLAYCDKLPYYLWSAYPWSLTVPGISFAGDAIYIYNRDKQWLQANPTTVVYELASPYYELIDEYNNTILNIPNTVAHLTHTSTVPVNNTVFTNYKDELNVLEANTQYRVMFDCDKANVPFTVTLGGTSQEVTSKKGTHSLLITTPSELVDKNLVIDGIGRCGIDNIRIFKGDVEYDYVKGLWSGYEERRLVNYLPPLGEGSTLYNGKPYFITGVYTGHNCSLDIENNMLTINTGTCKDYIYVGVSLKNVTTPLKKGLIYTIVFNLNFVRTFVNIGNTDYPSPSTRMVSLKNYGNVYCCAFTFKPTDLYMVLNTFKNDNNNKTIKNVMILEGDWTDNPPTYEEVMANEGKYAVKVKLDTNANIFGKGGRL